jgi:hypothetical protein
MADHLPKGIRQTLEKLKDNANGANLSLLNKLDRQLAGMVPADGGGVMRVESMVSSDSKNPEVTFIWGQNKGQLGVIEAKGYAMQILESCEAAVQDAALYRAFTEGPMAEGHDPKEQEHMAWRMIQLVRDNRGAFEQGGE